MKLYDMFVYAFNSLRQRSLRSWLTVLGVVVGITSIILLIGLVGGLRNYFTDQVSAFGSKTIAIVPINTANGANPTSFVLPTSGKLFMKDYERVKKIPGIEAITPVITGRTTLKYKDHEIALSVLGLDPDEYQNIVPSLTVEKGRFLNPVDQMSVALGNSISKDSFDRPVTLYSALYISGREFRVVGILNKFGSSFANLDSTVFIPLQEAEEIFKDVLSEKEISSIRLSVAEGSDVKSVSDAIETELLAAHHVSKDNKDFGIITSDFINQQLDSVTAILGLFLGGIGGISLVVGGIGIANTMFMSVTERKREIGILKSIGARETDILQIFLIESSIIGIGGGLLGILLASALASLITILSGIAIDLSVTLILFAIIFSAGVGILSGVFPARQAAKLDPIEVLGG